MFSWSKNAQEPFVEQYQLKIICLNDWYITRTIDKTKL